MNYTLLSGKILIPYPDRKVFLAVYLLVENYKDGLVN